MSEGEVGGLENKEVEYDGKNMEAVVVLLNFLHDRMDRVRFSYLVQKIVLLDLQMHALKLFLK